MKERTRDSINCFAKPTSAITPVSSTSTKKKIAPKRASISVDIFQQRKLLLCDLLSERGEPLGGSIIALDTVGAGAGETVLILDEGNSARQIIGRSDAPVRALIVGIVDQVDLQLDLIESKHEGR